MFCGKCGNQLNDGAAFCGACGNAVGQPQQTQTPVQQQPVEQPPVQQPTPPTSAANNTVSLPEGLITIPKISEFFVLGASLLMFIFMLTPWFRYKYYWYSRHYSIFTSNASAYSDAIGVAKAFGIISIILFVIFALLNFFDIRKIIKGIPEKLDFKKYAAYAFGASYFLQWFLTFIGMVAERTIGVSPCFIVAFIFLAVYAVIVFVPGLLDKILKDLFKINKDYF